MQSSVTLPESAKPRSELALFLKSLRGRIDPHVRALGPHVRCPHRLGKRVTQEELAEAIGVTREWYAMLESATTTRPSTSLADRLADALMVTPEERARLFRLAVPEAWHGCPGDDSLAVLDAYSRLRSLTKRLWTATSVEEILTTASEQIADWFDGAVLVRSSRRRDSGLWEPRSVDDKQDQSKAAKAIEEIARRVLRTTGSIDGLCFYPRLASAGDVATPDLWPLPVQREMPKVCERLRVAGFAGMYARVLSRSGFIGALYIVHDFGHSYSASDHAVFGAFAELTSVALS
jgi:transcriptional regulator with XRE-family HTH domain